MNDAEIQIQFPQPGNWQEFTLTAIYQDKGGYRPPARYTQAPAIAAVVAALVGLGEDWQAVQVWAHLMTATVYNEDDPYTPIGQRDEVALDVEAIHAETGGRRIFTVYDYPDFVITDPAAVAFFRFFTTASNR